MKLVGIVKFHNEEEHLDVCLSNLKKICHEICCYNAESTDKSLEIAKQYTEHIETGPNDFMKESRQRQLLLNMAIGAGADWILWSDADEVIDKIGTNGGIRKLIESADRRNIDSFVFQEINLWRSNYWFRIDSQFGDGWFNRLWRNNGQLYYDMKDGLHLPPFPVGLRSGAYTDIKVIHYGFSTVERLVQKYQMYRKHGMTDGQLKRLIDESQLEVRPVNQKWYDSRVELPLEKKEMKEWLKLIYQ